MNKKSTSPQAQSRRAQQSPATCARHRLPMYLVIMVGLTGGWDPVPAADTLYAAPSVDEARDKTMEWVAARQIRDELLLQRIRDLWEFEDVVPPARVLLQTVIDSFALADAQTRRLIEACSFTGAPLRPADAEQLRRDGAGEFYQANVTLYYARYLAQARLYDEALEAFASLDPHSVVDPATCLFYRAVCEQQLLVKDPALVTLEKLLEQTADVPVGYERVATLMRHELGEIKEKSLGEVSRKMRDSERRLDLGRGGQKVQKVQDEIIATLDEIIEKLEQQSGGGGGGGAGNSGNQSSAPAEDSRIKGQTAPGDVDHKTLKKQGGWGALPPKDASRAKNLINRDFPAHYRRAVEEYFKKLADRPAAP